MRRSVELSDVHNVGFVLEDGTVEEKTTMVSRAFEFSREWDVRLVLVDVD